MKATLRGAHLGNGTEKTLLVTQGMDSNLGKVFKRQVQEHVASDAMCLEGLSQVTETSSIEPLAHTLN